MVLRNRVDCGKEDSLAWLASGWPQAFGGTVGRGIADREDLIFPLKDQKCQNHVPGGMLGTRLEQKADDGS